MTTWMGHEKKRVLILLGQSNNLLVSSYSQFVKQYFYCEDLMRLHMTCLKHYFMTLLFEG
jgi:hypothetical protein